MRTALVRTSLGAVLNEQVLQSITTVVGIRDDPAASNKDRLNAAFWLAGVAGVAPVQKSAGTLVVDQIQERASQQVKARVETMTPDELRDGLRDRLRVRLYPELAALEAGPTIANPGSPDTSA